MKKSVASTAVARDRKFAEPVAPNRLEEAPPPKPEPMSAPFPCCSSTRPMIASATTTCTTMIRLVQNPILLVLSPLAFSGSRLPLRRRRGARDGEEIRRHQRGAADQAAVDIRHRKHRRRVLRLHAAAIENAHARRNPLARERMHRLRLLRCRGAPGADRPYRLVSQYRF